MTNEQINRFINDMLNNYDINLSTVLKGSSNKETVFINKVHRLVLLEIKENNPGFRENKITPNQQEAIYQATLEQAEYILKVGNTNLIAGYDPTTNSFINLEELRKRAFSPVARKILLTSGLLYRGIGARSFDGYIRY